MPRRRWPSCSAAPPWWHPLASPARAAPSPACQHNCAHRTVGGRLLTLHQVRLDRVDGVDDAGTDHSSHRAAAELVFERELGLLLQRGARSGKRLEWGRGGTGWPGGAKLPSHLARNRRSGALRHSGTLPTHEHNRLHRGHRGRIGGGHAVRGQRGERVLSCRLLGGSLAAFFSRRSPVGQTLAGRAATDPSAAQCSNRRRSKGAGLSAPTQHGHTQLRFASSGTQQQGKHGSSR